MPMHMVLRPFLYQLEGAKWLESKKCALLADKQRLGKSAQAIIASDRVGARRILVVCKGVARANWAHEFGKFSPRKFTFQILFDRTPISRPPLESVTICSYETLDVVLRAVENCGLFFDVAIIDESHYLKTLDTRRTQRILGAKGLVSQARRTWCLTGTPTPNGHPGELWTLLYVFGATRLKYLEFVRKFCITRPTGYGNGFQIVGANKEPEVLEEWYKMVGRNGNPGTVALRRTEEHVAIELPEISFSTIMVSPGRVHLATTQFYKYMIPTDRSKEFNALIEKELGIFKGILEDKTLSDELLLSLQGQAKSISTLRKFSALQKLEPACELITQELEAGAYRKVVIFAHHKDMIEGTRIRLQKFHPMTLYGGSNPRKVEVNLRKFQNPKSECQVFIGNIAAAGTSITLDAANHIFFLEESWTPADNAQAAMRCGGPNQKKPIFVRNFCLDNPIDMRIQDILRDKMAGEVALWGAQKKEINLPSELL